MKRAAFALIAACVLALPAAAQTPYYVSLGGDDLAAGTCDAPVQTVAAAIALAEADGGATEIRVSAGTYGEVNLEIAFSDVALKGGYDPALLAGGCVDADIEAARDATAFPTIIDALAAATPDRILDVLPNIDATDPDNPIFLSMNQNILIDGLQFLNGIPMRMLEDGSLGGSGGAIVILNCDNVVLSNNVFQNNQTNNHFFRGGAVYFATYATAVGEFHAGALDLQGNVFDDNSTGNGVNSSGLGGALAAVDGNEDGVSVVRGTTVNATGNVFTNNVSAGSGDLGDTVCLNQDCDGDGAADSCISRAAGGAVFLVNTFGTWDGNGFQDNSAQARIIAPADISGQGGAMFSFSSPVPNGVSPLLTNNTFTDNLARAGQGDLNGCGWQAGWGGALYLVNFGNELTNNQFVGNLVDTTLQTQPAFSGRGGGVFLVPSGTISSGSRTLVDGNVFDGNRVNGGTVLLGAWGGGLHVSELGGGADPIVTNNVFTNNIVQTTTNYRAAYGAGLQFSASGNYPLVARNLFTYNAALGMPPFITGLGGAAHFRMQRANAIVAENTVRENTARELVAGARSLAFAGFVFGVTRFDTDSQPARAPLVQSNLIVDNDGSGVSVFGRWSDFDGNDNGVNDQATEQYPHGPRIRYNTIANNTGAGLMLNYADEAQVVGNIIFGNNTVGDGFGNISDDFIQNDGDGGDPPNTVPKPSENVVFRDNLVEDFPAEHADQFVDPMTAAPVNGHVIGMDPLWIDPTNPVISARNYRLQQAPDQPMTSPAVDAGASGAIGVDYATPMRPEGQDVDRDGDPTNDNMFNRSTNFPSERPDVFFVDLGYHYPLNPAMPVVDTDGDGVPDDIEVALAGSDPLYSCLDPNDADSDDDGVVDGLDVGADLDGDGTVAACDCDADGDGLTDGRELDIDTPDADTDMAATCDTSAAPLGCGDPAQPSFDPGTGTTTDPLNPDTDGGGELDGCEALMLPCPFGGAPRNPNSDSDDDPDRDCVSTQLETNFSFTDPFDADTDDDGVSDGDEGNPADPLTDFTDALVCDTDGDGLTDGVERGVLDPVADPDGPDYPAVGTDLAALCVDTDGDGMPDEPAFISVDPADPAYRDTHAAEQTIVGGMPGFGNDTDGDGCLDGQEDVDHDGLYEPDGADGMPGTDDDESDPTVAGDCAAAVALRISGDVTALSGGTAACGPQTTPPVANLLDSTATCMPIPQPADYSVECPMPRVDPTEAGGSSMPWTGSATLVGAGAPGGSLLTFYEITDCNGTLMVTKDGADLELTQM